MSNPVSLFERLNKERPKPTDTEKPKLEVLPNPPGADKYGRDKTKLDNNIETSPTKNFTKTSNSIIKLAIPEKYFRGQSKHTYDVLYQRTRGAVVPVRQIQLSKAELVKLTGLSEKTVQLHIRYLRDSNLIAVHPQMGSRSGWAYEVFVPEEFNDLFEYGQDKIRQDKTMQNLSSQTMQNLSILVHTNPLENKGLNPLRKTSFKTSTRTDDEALRAMTDVLTNACEKVCGKIPQKKDREKWKELAELLAMELEIAAARAGSISSVPAFLTEHLRRRLIQKPNLPKPKASKSLQSEGSESEPPVYEAESLSRQGREVVLKTFREYVEKGQQDFVLSFESAYTGEDWLFLMKNLKREEPYS